MQAVIFKDGNKVTHLSQITTALFLSQESYNLVRLIEKYFPIQLESLRAHDSPEAPFFLLSRDTFFHLHSRQMRRQGTRKHFAQHIYAVAHRITGTAPK